MDDLSSEEVDSVSEALKEEENQDSENTEIKDKEEHRDADNVSGQESAEFTPPSSSLDLAGESGVHKAQFLQLEEVEAAAEIPISDLKRMSDVKVDLEVRLGETKMSLDKILQLQSGSVVELDRLAGEPVDIHVNNHLVARAEVVVIDDSFGVRIIEIIGTKQKLSVFE